MSDLLKIRDVSNKYNITTRTLRYYEEKGLLTSIRSKNFTGRFYDETSIRRLEQILFFRQSKLSIKDIQGIFKTTDPDELLLSNMDNETESIRVLKYIIIDFILEIEELNFSDNSEIKLLKKKIKEIKKQLTSKSII